MTKNITSNHDLILCIEKIRKERKMTIKSLTKDLLSTRSYTRLLANESLLTFEVLSKFLDRLQVPIFDFSFYVYNHNFYKYIDEITFFDYVRSGLYQIAYDEYYPKIEKGPWGSILAKKSIPISIVLMNYKLNKMNQYDSYYQIKEIIDLKSILKSVMLSGDDLEAMNIFIEICTDQEKTDIANYLYLVMENKVRILSISIEQATTLVHLVALKALTTKVEISQEDIKLINKIFHLAIEYQQRAKMAMYDVMLYKILYTFVRRLDLSENLIVFAYITSILSTINSVFTEEEVVKIRETDIHYILSLLNDDVFLSKNFYMEMINNEI